MKSVITQGRYKDRPAILIKTPRAVATFLPEDGGKLASLQAADGWEFLEQAKGDAYGVLAYDGSYVEAECSACDDMYPTIDPCTPSPHFPEYPDHGEVCRMPFTVKVEEQSFTLSVVSRRLGFTYEKRVTCDEEGHLLLHYTIHNGTAYEFPDLWAMHCMLRGDESARLLLPFDEAEPVEMMFGPPDALELPRDRLLPFAADAPTYKFYYPGPMPEGFCGCRYEKNGHQVLFRFDEKKVPYLGLWLNSGGFKGMYNLALEPCTALYDTPDRALQRGRGSCLAPGETVTFTIRVEIQ